MALWPVSAFSEHIRDRFSLLFFLPFFFLGDLQFHDEEWLVQTETSRVGGGGSLSPASARLQPGHKLLGRLVLQVGAHVAGVGAVCVPSKHPPAGRHRRESCSHAFAVFGT